MKNFYYLESCSTCKRIMKELDLPASTNLREIKSSPLTAEEADRLAAKVGSYEAIFSKRAVKYRSMGLNKQELSEKDYRRFLLEDYTFLKRPVAETDSAAVAGNSKKAVAEMKDLI